MLLLWTPRILLTFLLASLAISPCLTVPVGTGNTPPPTPNTNPGGVAAPVTPAGKPSALFSPTAPHKKKLEAPIEVTQFIVDWMKKSQFRLRGSVGSNGGTEAWVQFDFEMECKDRQGISPERRIGMREVRVYASSRQAADWVFDPGNGRRGLIVELKVQSRSQFGTRFSRLVRDDQQKVSGELKPKYKNFDVGVYALAWGEDTKKELLTKANMVAVPSSEIPLEKEKGSLMLYKWDGDLVNPPAESNSLAAGVPLANPQAQKLSFKNPPTSGQTPGPVTDSTAAQTPGGPDTQTPTKNPSKGKGTINKLKLGSGSGSGSGSSGGGSGK